MDRLRLDARVTQAIAVTAGGWRPRLSLAAQFLLANLGILLLALLVTSVWIGDQIEAAVVGRTAGITALYVDSVVSSHLQGLAKAPRLDADAVAALDSLLGTSLGARVVAFKIWSPDGEILYSPNRQLTGRRFPVRGGLARALKGDLTAEISDLSEPENEYERQLADRLLEVYAPVRGREGGPIIAVTEFYQRPDELDNSIATARLQSWAVVGGIAVVTYILLAGIVKRGSDTIASQERSLRRQVAELQQVLQQNARLHERVRQAARSTTALNEQALRRVGADLHDGPGQVLALALLRLDAPEMPEEAGHSPKTRSDVPSVREAVQEALNEIRSITAGLRLPELAPLPVAEAAERVVAEHQRRSGTAVTLESKDVPESAPLAIKIALVRTLQEALSNASRHGQGAAVSARLWREDDVLCLAVSDAGPGFVPQQVEAADRLGLIVMRERAELLGGHFEVASAPGRGTRVQACWPLSDRGEGWTDQSV